MPKPTDAARNVGHGHVHPRPDGRKARCGGPGLCGECSAEATLKAAEEWARYEDAAAALALLDDTVAVLRNKEVQMSREALASDLAVISATLTTLLAVEEPPPPPVEENPFGLDMRVHSRACGIVPHGHGSACHKNCPTCHGRADFPHEGMAGEGRRAGL